MGALSAWHWLIILVVLVVLFGSKKLPDAARGLGRRSASSRVKSKRCRTTARKRLPHPSIRMKHGDHTVIYKNMSIGM